LSEILNSINIGNAWLGLGWRFFLYWFCDIENRINNNSVSPIELIKNADKNWGLTEDKNIIFEERRNNGNWVRQWLRAILEYKDTW